MIILFLMLSYYWISPNGFISAIFDHPIKEHSGFICRQGDFEENTEWMYDRDKEQFIKKPALIVNFQKDTLRIISTNTKCKTSIEFLEKFIKGKEPKDVQNKIIETSSVGVAINTKQSFEVGNIIVKNELAYPMCIWLEIKK